MKKYPKLQIIRKDPPEDGVDVIDIDESRIVPISPFCVHASECGVYLERRAGGNFKGRAIYLDYRFDWVIGKDDEGSTIAVATHKKES